jgi:aspartyl-tRNA(Asn)/glutamyl-tRNA(Gln) amidotransferase subunit A
MTNEQARNTYKKIAELGEMLRLHQISSLEIVTDCLERIDRSGPTLNAFITVLREEALVQAELADKEIKSGNWRGPVHGIPVAVKDFFDTAGIKTTAAFEEFKDRIPTQDAETVAKLKKAGAIIIGKTNMHQLGMGTTSVKGYFGAVHNPWNPDYMAGGSSGGSAAALAAGMCYATVDTDAIGSARLPASCCGVTAIKATYGLLSTKGILEGMEVPDEIRFLGHSAVAARSVEDAAIVLNAIADTETAQGEFREDYSAAFGAMKHPRLAVVKNFKATDEVRENFQKAVAVFRSLGSDAAEVEVPFESATFDMKTIVADRQNISETLFSDVDVLLLPTTTEITPTIEEAQRREAASDDSVAFEADNTFFCNYYGLPAVTIPSGFDHNGLPLGLQIVGRQWDEARVLDTAFRYQNATDWIQSRSKK